MARPVVPWALRGLRAHAALRVFMATTGIVSTDVRQRHAGDPTERGKHAVAPRSQAHQEPAESHRPVLHRPRYGRPMRLNYVAAAVSFVTSVVFFLTRNIATGAVFLAVGAVFIALDPKPPKEPER